MQTGSSNRGKPRSCFLPCGLALLTTLAVWQSASAQVQLTRPQDAGRIAAAAGGRLQFIQDGRQLTLPAANDIDTLTVELPHRWIVESAARVDGSVWISGRSNAAEIDDIFVAAVDHNGKTELKPTPPGREYPRGSSSLLIDQGQLVGIAWLEGERQETFSVRAAAWLGSDWGSVEEVAPPLGTAQTALRGIILADGSWLLIWAAVDTDDDLVWSQRTREGWAQPRRVHPDNDVPDVYPLAIALGESALVAWSWFDGNDYRLRLSTLTGGTWEEQDITSGRGSVVSRLVVSASGVELLYNSVVPDVWVVKAFNGEGRESGHWEAPLPRRDTPLLRTGDLWSLQWEEANRLELKPVATGSGTR